MVCFHARNLAKAYYLQGEVLHAITHWISHLPRGEVGCCKMGSKSPDLEPGHLGSGILSCVTLDRSLDFSNVLSVGIMLLPHSTCADHWGFGG